MMVDPGLQLTQTSDVGAPLGDPMLSHFVIVRHLKNSMSELRAVAR